MGSIYGRVGYDDEDDDEDEDGEMVYQSGFPQSPFARPPEPKPVPPVLKPLVYCQFRTSLASGGYGEQSEVNLCPVFASALIGDMPFCFNHSSVIVAALEAEEAGGAT